jgi:hypothetical protein
MEIKYTAHLEFRLRIRNIPYEVPRRVYAKAQEHYVDNLTKHNIAIGTMEFQGKVREMAVSYDKTEKGVELITVHPIKPYQKRSRINIGRWERI